MIAQDTLGGRISTDNAKEMQDDSIPNLEKKVSTVGRRSLSADEEGLVKRRF